MTRAHEIAAAYAALSPSAFAQTKAQIRQGVVDRLAQNGAATDRAVTAIWTAPEALRRVADYVEKTLKKELEPEFVQIFPHARMNEFGLGRGGGGVLRRGFGGLREAFDESGVAFVDRAREGVSGVVGKIVARQHETPGADRMDRLRLAGITVGRQYGRFSESCVWRGCGRLPRARAQ